MSDGSESDEEVREPEREDGKQENFRQVLLKHPILLNKSQEPSIKAKKEKAAAAAIAELKSLHGQEFTRTSLSQKISRMKDTVKKKTDKNKTGNNSIKLKKWEAELFDLLGAEKNPILGKVQVR